MYNIFKKHRRWRLVCSILSLSLLTVMAGAAVAPALGLIQEYFTDTDRGLVQMIVSMPAFFIALSNLFLFRPLSKRLRARTLLIIGLVLYVIFGCAAGLFSNIVLILICRVFVGIGVGFIMPLSTGLLSFYFTKDKQAPLMGYSSALNMMGGVVATLIAGGLAMISWRLSFLVYLLGLISIILSLIWMPNEKIYDPGHNSRTGGSMKQYLPYIAVMFFMSLTFFIYPSSFALECTKSGALSQGMIAPVMAMMDVFGFIGGLAFPHLRRRAGTATKYIAPVLFVLSYVLLGLCGGIIGVLSGSAFVGLANGIGVPFLMTSASAKAGRKAATAVMPLLSASLYAAQFLTPVILSVVSRITGAGAFVTALAASVCLAAATLMIRVRC